MAQSTVLNEFFNIISFKTDQASLKQAQTAIVSFKSLATKVLGTLGVGLSLSWVKNITEEFSGINDAIRGATEGLGEQSEIQKKILASAQECRESYGKMAGYVDDLVVKNKTLFPIDDAVKFTALVEKLEKGSGKSSNISTTMGLLSKAMSSEKVDKSTFSQLYEKAPEVAALIEKSTGKSKTQLEAMAKAGTLSATTVKKAVLEAEDDIQRKFGEVDLKITDAITHIRNSWGYWLEDIDSTCKITDKLSRLIIDFSDKLLNGAKKVKSWMDDIANKLGGYDKLLKLVAMSAAALYIAFNTDKITKFLTGVVGLLDKINLKTILAAAKWLALFLIIEDIWTFFQGGDSVFGRMLKEMGVDTDALREKVIGFFEQIPPWFEKVKKFVSEHAQQIFLIIGILGTLAICIDKIPRLINGIDKAASLASKALSFVGISPKLQLIIGIALALFLVFRDFWNFLHGKDSIIEKALEEMGVDTDKLRENIFGFIEAVKEKAAAFKDWLSGIFDWFGEKIEWAKNLARQVKAFFTGGGSSTDEDDFGGSSGGTIIGKSDTSGKSEKSGSQSNSSTPERTTGSNAAASSNAGSSKSSTSTSSQNVPYLNRQNSIPLMNNQAWTGGTGVSAKTIKSSPVNNNTKNVSVRQENNQKYTFNVKSTDAADKLQSEVSAQSTQSADGLARMLNYGR